MLPTLSEVGWESRCGITKFLRKKIGSNMHRCVFWAYEDNHTALNKGYGLYPQRKQDVVGQLNRRDSFLRLIQCAVN